MTHTRTTITLNDIHTVLEAHTQSRGWLDRNLFKEHPTIAAMRSHYENLKLAGRPEEQALSDTDLLPLFIPVVRIHAYDKTQADAIYTLAALQKLFGLTQTEGAYYNHNALYAAVQSMQHECSDFQPYWLRLYQQRASLAEIEVALGKYQKLVGGLDPIAFNEICDLAEQGKIEYASRMASGLAALKIVDGLTEDNLRALREDFVHAEEVGKAIALQAVNLGTDEQNLYTAIKDNNQTQPEPEVLKEQILDPRLSRRREQALKWLVPGILVFLLSLFIPGVAAPLLGFSVLFATFGAATYLYFRTEAGRQLKVERPQRDDSFYRALKRCCEMQKMQKEASAQFAARQAVAQGNLHQLGLSEAELAAARAVQALHDQQQQQNEQQRRNGGSGNAGGGASVSWFPGDQRQMPFGGDYSHASIPPTTGAHGGLYPDPEAATLDAARADFVNNGGIGAVSQPSVVVQQGQWPGSQASIMQAVVAPEARRTTPGVMPSAPPVSGLGSAAASDSQRPLVDLPPPAASRPSSGRDHITYAEAQQLAGAAAARPVGAPAPLSASGSAALRGAFADTARQTAMMREQQQAALLAQEQAAQQQERRYANGGM
jgi:hypothetical protein